MPINGQVKKPPEFGHVHVVYPQSGLLQICASTEVVVVLCRDRNWQFTSVLRCFPNRVDIFSGAKTAVPSLEVLGPCSKPVYPRRLYSELADLIQR